MKVAMNKMLIWNYYLFGILPDDLRAFKDYYKEHPDIEVYFYDSY